MKRGTGATVLRVGMVLGIASAALTSLLWTLACSSSSASGGALVGEWQQTDDAGYTSSIFFNSNGTCGEFFTADNAIVCDSNCTYQVNGNSVSIVFDADGGVGNFTELPFRVSGNTLTFEPADGGSSFQLTRVNSNGSNSCP